MSQETFAAAGPLRGAYEAVDWATTPLGPQASWSPTLRAVLDVAWNTRFPVTLFWGPELVLLYNAAFVPLIADKHPGALGAPARGVFPEIWDQIGLLLNGVLDGGGAVWVQDAHLPLYRHGGQLEDAYFTFSYSPVRGGDDVIEGVLDIATETTGQVVDQRRLSAVAAAATALVDATDEAEVADIVAEHGLTVMGCAGGAVSLVDAADPGVMTTHLSTGLRADGADGLDGFAAVSVDVDLPMCRAALTGAPVLLRDEVACAAAGPLMAQVAATTGCQAFACLPMRTEDGVSGALTAAWRTPPAFLEDQLELLGALTAQCSQALARVRARRAERSAALRTAEIAESMAVGYLAVDADWRVTYVNAQAVAALGRPREELLEKVIWDLFPDTLGTDFKTGYRRAADSGQAFTVDAYYPEPLNAWYEVRATPASGGVALYFLDITERRAAQSAAEAAAAQQAALVAAAQALGEADSETGVLAVVAVHGAQLLGADGLALCLHDPEATHARILTTDSYSQDVRAQLERVPLDFPLPAVRTATTGTPFFHVDRAETLALFPDAEALYVAGRVQASAAVPLRAHGRLLGCLSVSSEQARTWRSQERELLAALAALTAQSLDRVHAREAERAANRTAARFSETLQRSLLTSPPEPDHLHVVARYSPAAADAYVGGDWYDAFTTAAGVTSVVIGDVAGHDQFAAAAMGQLRNLLRGIAYAVGDPPAAVLSVLDQAAQVLAVDALATLVLAQVEQGREQGASGARMLRWSNAGHPPPLLIEADGTTRLLATEEADLLIGIDPDTNRHDHQVLLRPGATVLLYTDGLIERRDASLDEGTAWLVRAGAQLAHLSPEELCDTLLTLVGDRVEDDVALIAVRVQSFDAPSVDATSGPVALELEPDPAAVRQARAHVLQQCRAHDISEDTCDSLVLLTSEVVTNAVLHGQGHARLTVHVSAVAVRVEVSDDESRHPVIAAPDHEALHGRGIVLVEALSTTWGVRDEPGGKTVWFQIDT